MYVRIKSLEEKVQGDQELQLQLEPFLQVKKQRRRRRMFHGANFGFIGDIGVCV